MKCARKVVENHDSKNYALYGQEAIGSTWSLAKMNMFLHGEDNHKIEWGDTIRNPKLLDQNGDLMLFDIVTANNQRRLCLYPAHDRNPKTKNRPYECSGTAWCFIPWCSRGQNSYATH